MEMVEKKLRPKIEFKSMAKPEDSFNGDEQIANVDDYAISAKPEWVHREIEFRAKDGGS